MTSYRLWPGLCNSFLAGALELRSGIPQGASPDSGGPDMISAMSTELFLDFIGSSTANGILERTGHEVIPLTAR